MKIDRTGITTLLILLLIVAIVGVSVFLLLQHREKTQLRESLAGTALTQSEVAAQYTDLAGNALSLESYLGSVFIVYSWASWCPQCAADLQVLDSYAQEHSESIVVLAINRAEPAATAERFLNHTIGTDTSLHLVLDSDDRFYNSLAGYAMPETIVFDKTGSEVTRLRTQLTTASLNAAIDKANRQ